MEERGPFDEILQTEPREPRRDRSATVIVALAIGLGLLLLVLVLPPISVLDRGDEPALEDVSAVAREELPALPEGFEAVSRLYDLSTPNDPRQPLRLTVPLSAQLAVGERVQFFTYEDDGWRELGDGEVIGEGGDAQSERLSALPPNVAVLRPTEQAGGRTVLGSLPPGGALDERALGLLSALNPWGFTPAPDGSIVGDPALVPSDLQLPLVPTISAPGPTEQENVNAILASPELRAAHIEALLQFARDGGYAGLDLDYRAIDPALGGNFVAFVQELGSRLHQENRTLTLTLPLPVRQDDQWDTLGFPWEVLVPAVDGVKLVTDAPADQYYQRVEEALAYLVSRVSGSKLLLTVRSLSRERSVDGERLLNLTEALTLASTPVVQAEGPVAPGATVNALAQNLADELGATGLHWDATAQAVSFTYAGPGGERTVWLANRFSEAYRLELARRYGLGGVAVEDVSAGAADADVWPAVEAYARTGQATLVQPNGSLLLPRWAASGGELSSETGARVTWRSPGEAGTYTLTLVVSDGVVRLGQRLQVAVEAPPAATTP